MKQDLAKNRTQPKDTPKKKKPAILNVRKKIKVSEKSPKSFLLTEKTKKSGQKTKKVKTVLPSKTAKSTTEKTAPISASKKTKAVAEKPKPINAKNKKDLTLKTKTDKARQIATSKTPSPIKAKINAKISTKKVEPKVIKTKVKTVVAVKKIEPVEKKIEATKLPRKMKPKKVKPISSAVFRGKKERYDFQVFGLNESFEQIPAVYIISKRKTDKRKKSHHALICIGQTNSVPDEIKLHKKSRCLQKNNANVISLLHESDEQKRLKIETDLKAAHSIQCQRAQKSVGI